VGMTSTRFTIKRAGFGIGMLAAGALTLAACGSSSKSSSTAATTAPVSSGAAGSSGAGASGGPTIAAASVPGVGTVLVNGSGQTLYVLSSEAGGKLTCTDANGCTKFWPDLELPAGVAQATAGSGIQSSMLSSVKDSKGALYVTYAGYPLYTFIMDTGSGTAKGEGIKSFGGTWTAMNPDGTPVAPGAATTTATTAAPSGGGYGY
jgi:predicted lipoprotein with Yx(FWY)xxD motif